MLEGRKIFYFPCAGNFTHTPNACAASRKVWQTSGDFAQRAFRGRALRRMVEKFYAQPDTQILLLAYTNRAVDEICSSLNSIAPSIDYIRIGSELSCDERYREHLVENVLASYHKRLDVRQRLSACRVYVGTVASLSSKTEIFKLKRFDVAIVDEATQILEPQLLWLLSAKSPDGQDAVGKFVLIGDHKQLPAVVLQRKEQSEVFD